MAIEHLQRRCLPAVISVNSAADTATRDDDLTLREAILVNHRLLALANLTNEIDEAFALDDDWNLVL